MNSSATQHTAGRNVLSIIRWDTIYTTVYLWHMHVYISYVLKNVKCGLSNQNAYCVTILNLLLSNQVLHNLKMFLYCCQTLSLITVFFGLLPSSSKYKIIVNNCKGYILCKTFLKNSFSLWYSVIVSNRIAIL